MCRDRDLSAEVAPRYLPRLTSSLLSSLLLSQLFADLQSKLRVDVSRHKLSGELLGVEGQPEGSHAQTAKGMTSWAIRGVPHPANWAYRQLTQLIRPIPVITIREHVSDTPKCVGI